MKMINSELHIKLEMNEKGLVSEDVTIRGSMGLNMHALAIVAYDMEMSLPESRRAQFRADLLGIINDIRNERNERKES